MIRCKKCGRYAKLHSWKENDLTGRIKGVKVKCSKCGIVPASSDWIYEDIYPPKRGV